jgi:hypothetical protein
MKSIGIQQQERKKKQQRFCCNSSNYITERKTEQIFVSFVKQFRVSRQSGRVFKSKKYLKLNFFVQKKENQFEKKNAHNFTKNSGWPSRINEGFG